MRSEKNQKLKLAGTAPDHSGFTAAESYLKSEISNHELKSKSKDKSMYNSIIRFSFIPGLKQMMAEVI